MKKKIKLLLADDHVIIRNGIKLLLEKKSTFKIVGEANNGQEVIDYLNLNAKNVDVILMDINMPDMGGVEATKNIKNNFQDVKILALSMHAEEVYILEMLKSGAAGYVLKEAGAEELILAIETVANGKKYYSNDVSNTIINSLMNGDVGKKQIPKDLSEREITVIKLLSEGATNKEIGEVLNISPRTVETHRRNILGKLELRNTAQLIRYAVENRFVA